MPISSSRLGQAIFHSLISSGVQRVPALRCPQTALITAGLQPLPALAENSASAKGRTAIKIAVMLMLVGMGTLTRAQGKPNGADSTVTVFVPESTNYPCVNLYWAKEVASTMFASAGVHIRWQAGQPESHRSTGIVLSLTSKTPENFPPATLAYAQVFEGVHIRIFVDHVAENAHRLTALGTSLLAHVMVHEITHILQGVNRHSQEGIMKRTWTQSEIQRMVVSPLSFTPEDIHLIHTRLAISSAPEAMD